MSRKTILALAAVAALGMSTLTPSSVLAFGRLGSVYVVHTQVSAASRSASRPVGGRATNSINARKKIASGINPDG